MVSAKAASNPARKLVSEFFEMSDIFSEYSLHFAQKCDIVLTIE